MSLNLVREAGLPAPWKAGPDPVALTVLLGERPSRLRLDRTHFPGKRPVQLVYAATMRSGLEVPVLAEHCPGGAVEHAARATESLGKSRNGQRQALAASPVLADRASGLVLRRPGLDERLPGLRVLHDAGFAREVVAHLVGTDPGPVRTRLMAHRLGKRAVVRIDASTGRFYARLRAIKSGEGETRQARHLAVWEALGPHVPLAVPEPLGTRPEIGLSLFGELAGAAPDFGRDHRAVAGALAALQGLPLGALPVHSGADEARILRGWHDRCGRYLPDLSDGIGCLVSRSCSELEAGSGPLRPCHRDLHEKQVLVARGRAGILDFDTLSLADPALDAGNLLAHLFFARLDERPFRDAVGGDGVALWRRAALLRLAMIYAFTSTSASAIRRLIREAAG